MSTQSRIRRGPSSNDEKDQEGSRSMSMSMSMSKSKSNSSSSIKSDRHRNRDRNQLRDKDYHRSSHYKRQKISSRNAHSRHEQSKGQERMARIDENSSVHRLNLDANLEWGEGQGQGQGQGHGDAGATPRQRYKPKPQPRSTRSHGSNGGKNHEEDGDDMEGGVQDPSRYSDSSSSSTSTSTSRSSPTRPNDRPQSGRQENDSLQKGMSDTTSPPSRNSHSHSHIDHRTQQSESDKPQSINHQSEKSHSPERMVVRHGDSDDGECCRVEPTPSLAARIVVRNRLLTEDGSDMTDAEIEDCLYHLDRPLPVCLHRVERSRRDGSRHQRGEKRERK
ncbi:hypothetical protein B0A52_01815 [Exophiala mesophila]|uniref:Uncharacterized protein n=1 Tax=Exophiala mesophila TaxID=212818 RepID=A0A438NG28_EXOME|nr:hypothetical protein B0A52_01815 [Exophiala mesophila]